jgi:hypothetical protein
MNLLLYGMNRLLYQNNERDIEMSMAYCGGWCFEWGDIPERSENGLGISIAVITTSYSLWAEVLTL